MHRLQSAASAAAPLFLATVLSGFMFAAPPSAHADDAAPGYALAALPYPGLGLVATLTNGDLIAFDGMDVARFDSTGTLLQVLASFPSFTFGSFLEVDPTESFAILGESSNQEIYKIDLTVGGLVSLASLTFTFDALFESPTSMIISASPCGFCGLTNFYHLDTTTGALVEFAQVSGPSGPIALDAAGNLFYATQTITFPAPFGATDIVRFDAALIASQVYLFDASATVVATGFDGGGSLACDQATGTLYLAESSFSTGDSFLYEVHTTRANSPVIATSGFFQSISGVEFVPGIAPARFSPYQPQFGGTLRYTTTDFFVVSERYHLQPARPVLALTGPGVSGPGLFDVELAGGPAGGVAIVVYGPQSLLAPVETGYLIGSAAPLFTGLDLFTFVYGPYLGLDTNGEASIGFNNPGTWQGTAAIQAILVDPLLGVVGTSTTALN